MEGVGLEELGARLLGVGVDLLEFEVVGLRDGADGRRAGVALCRAEKSATRAQIKKRRQLIIWRRSRAS